eukprot:g8027.t1
MRRAYATLLYSDFIEGTRALGQSLRDSGTTADTVVLVTPDVRQETRERLTQDGWIVRPVAVEANPNQNYQSRLVFVYTKLLIVEMEDEYDRVVFLDADTLVLDNIDELFECEPFCAVMRHSELLNSGVIVITPSRELYSHMHDLIGELDSYTGGDQGFLNSFYPYFAACPAFEPYPILGSRLPGAGGGGQGVGLANLNGRRIAKGGGRTLEHQFLEAKEVDDREASEEEDGEEDAEPAGDQEVAAAAGLVVVQEERRGLAGSTGGSGNGRGEWVRPKGWGCKRLPTRYNGDWPLLFVDGDLQVVQGKEAGPEAPADWKLRKKVKVLHFTFGTAKPWDWWTYPFLPYVDLWLEAFHRLESATGGSGPESGSRSRLGGASRLGRSSSRGGGGSRRGGGKGKRPRWSGVAAQLVYGLAPLLSAARRWTSTWRKLRNTGIAFARYTIPVKALNARSLLGSIYNLAVGLVLAILAAVLAFRSVPATQLGAARPEAAWAFFWGRATALVVLSEGFYLVLVSLKAHHVFTAPPPVETGAPYANIGANTSVSININALEYDGGGSDSYANSGAPTPTMTPLAGAGTGPGRRVPASAVAPAVTPPMVAITSAVGGGGGSVVEATGKVGGGSVGGPCGPRRLALTETVAHLAFLSAMAASLVSAPLWVGLNGFPASREIVPGIARLLALLAVFTFSAVRLPPLWAAHARSFDCRGSSTRNRVSSGVGSTGGSGGGRPSHGCGGWRRGRRKTRTDRLEMETERAALANLSPASDHHSA